MNKKVALLVGGWSAERQVSLAKGKDVAAALRAGGYDVAVIDVRKDLSFLESRLTPKPDVVFNNLYGKGGEDGTIQALLDILELPYTHSGVLASAMGMDKPLCKRMAASFGVKVPRDVVAPVGEVLAAHLIDPPYVIKPTNEGSSVGVCLVMEQENKRPQRAKMKAENWPFGERVMIEQYIPGRELTVAILDGQAQAVTEIVSAAPFFDYASKYHDERTTLVLPAEIPETVYNLALKNAEAVYNGIGCAGLARCDFRYDDSVSGSEGLYFLEINTQPGLTAESIGPSQVVYNGMSFVELCSHLVETAKCHGQKIEKERYSQDSQEALKTAALKMTK